MIAATSLDLRASSNADDRSVSVTRQLEPGSDEHPLNAAAILRSFDAVRRQLSRREFGGDGLGAGLDVVHVDLDSLAFVASSPLLVTGTVTVKSEHWCEIEYSAAARWPTIPGESPRRAIASARGRSLR